MRDLLSGKRGRLLTFFLLYITEGIPLGFTATAISTQMRRQGLSPAQIGLFVGSLYFPWALKWAAGPVVDLVYSDRLGRRRAWIVACQCGMMLTLLVAMPVPFSAKLGLFTAIILAHNAFGAVQDVAIDALAVTVLREDERGLANGLMFAGANVGQLIGGAGVLYLTRFVASFNIAFVLVVAAIGAVTAGVALRLREGPTPAFAVSPEGPGGVGAALRNYVVTAARSMGGSRTAFAALVFALLPTGVYALGTALNSTIAVDLGMGDDAIATLSLVSTLTAAVGCVAGGWLSDRIGRRATIASVVVCMVGPNLVLAAAMLRFGWGMPAAAGAGASAAAAATRPAGAEALLWAFWGATVAYSLLQGLMYGARTALYMDVSNPAVAATQFTAYMAMLNLVIAYSAAWTGQAAVRFGYPLTLALDAAAGLVCLAVMPFIKSVRPGEPDALEQRGFDVVTAPAEPGPAGKAPS